MQEQFRSVILDEEEYHLAKLYSLALETMPTMGGVVTNVNYNIVKDYSGKYKLDGLIVYEAIKQIAYRLKD